MNAKVFSTGPRIDKSEAHFDLLKRLKPKAEDDVKRFVKRWNQRIRNLVRSETGLALRIEQQETYSLPIKVVSGMPQPFVEAVDRSAQVIELIYELPLLRKTVKGLELVLENESIIRKERLHGGGEFNASEIESVLILVDHIADSLDQFSLVDQLPAIDEDVLGAYWYRLDRQVQWIEIYWMPIALIAPELGVSLEALTVVVLAHELGHGFTHIGADHDSWRWRTQDFKDSDLGIKEGLAQFYTECVCLELKSTFPEALEAYELLLKKQSQPYTVQKSWAPTNAARREVIRSTAVKCRKLSITSLEKFEELIKEEEKSLREREQDQPLKPRLLFD